MYRGRYYGCIVGNTYPLKDLVAVYVLFAVAELVRNADVLVSFQPLEMNQDGVSGNVAAFRYGGHGGPADSLLVRHVGQTEHDKLSGRIAVIHLPDCVQ
jgi:hypothetical protein